MTKVPIIKYMFRSDWKALTDALHSGTPYESESFESANDLTTYLSVSNFAIVVASLKTKEDLVQLVALVKSVKKVSPNTFMKIIVINFSGNKQFDKAVAKLDLDLTEENIQPKALRFKIDFMMKSIHAKIKTVDSSNSAANNLKTLQDSKNTQEKKVLEAGQVWTEPLDCEDDIWLLRNDSDCKKVLTRWLVKLMGPSPYIASWVDSGTNGVWKFEFKSEESILINGSGSWFFCGDQKPDFVWAENVWSFTGNKFDLYYKEGNTTFYRMNFKDKQFVIAKNSEYAKTKERSIIESFDKDLVLKKYAQLAAENKSFEIEQNNLKYLEGKNKTETLNQGLLSGKGKTDSLDLGPLSGKDKNSKIETNPLSMDLKPGENSTSSAPLAQNSETSKKSTYWKANNEYENEKGQGNLTKPLSQSINPGAELGLETSSDHQSQYKNHNETEKFDAKDNGSENLRRENNPEKSNSINSGSDLSGKNSIDQMGGHVTSPDAIKKEKTSHEKKGNDPAGKSTQSEAGDIQNELNGDDASEESKKEKTKENIAGQLAQLKIKKAQLENKNGSSGADKKSDKKSAFDKTSTNYSSKRKSKEFEEENPDELNNVLEFVDKLKQYSEAESLDSKELDDSIISAEVTSVLTQDSFTCECVLDDFFDRAIIFRVQSEGKFKINPILLNLSFNYMGKNTNLKFTAKVTSIENDGAGFQYVSVELSTQNEIDFNSFMKLYNMRQKNINFYLNAAKG